MRVWLLLCAITVGCGGSKIPKEVFQSEPKSEVPVVFDIDGMRVGDALTPEFRQSYGQDKDSDNPYQACMKKIRVRGNEVYVTYHFDHSTLMTVVLSFEPELYAPIIQAYSEKFGVEPHATKSATVNATDGTEYKNEVAEWETADGPFTLVKHTGDLTKGAG
jgi:hypothetical protein